jgi:hypothetical protein
MDGIEISSSGNREFVWQRVAVCDSVWQRPAVGGFGVIRLQKNPVLESPRASELDTS